MRTIKFRGICNEENTNYYGKWIHGYLGYENSINPVETVGDDEIEDYGIYDELTFINVRPETVGQFTGLHDKNGVEIYEGDIVHITRGLGNFANKKGQVVFTEGAFHIEGQWFTLSFSSQYGIEVIGNIHEEVEE